MDESTIGGIIMAIKGGYTKDKNLDPGKYKSSSMIGTEFEGKRGEVDFNNDWEEAFSDTLATLNVTTGGLMSMNTIGDMLYGMSSPEARDAYEKSTAKPLIDRTSGALGNEADFDKSVTTLMEDITNVKIHKMSPDGTYLDTESYVLGPEFAHLNDTQRKYIKEGIRDTLTTQGYGKDEFDTFAYGDSSDSAVFSKSEIKENRGKLGFRKKDTHEGKVYKSDDIDTSADLYKDYDKPRDRISITGERIGDVLKDGAGFIKDKWEENISSKLKDGEKFISFKKLKKTLDGFKKPTFKDSPYSKTKPDNGGGPEVAPFTIEQDEQEHKNRMDAEAKARGYDN